MKIFIKKFHFAYAFLFIILNLNCSDNVLETDSLPFKERLVVRALLEAGKPISVYAGRTLKIGETFTPDNAFLSDAVVSVTHKNVVKNLTHTANGNYTSNGFNASNGEVYYLSVKWKGIESEAATRVPFTAPYQNVKLVTEITGSDTSFYFETLLTPRPDAVYGATWSIFRASDTTRIEDTVVNNLARYSDKNLSGLLKIRTRNLSKELVDEYRDNLFIRIHAFDEQFYNFFITQNANNASTNIFSISGINLRWNVSGDAIGMFIGKSDFVIKIP